ARATSLNDLRTYTRMTTPPGLDICSSAPSPRRRSECECGWPTWRNRDPFVLSVTSRAEVAQVPQVHALRPVSAADPASIRLVSSQPAVAVLPLGSDAGAVEVIAEPVQQVHRLRSNCRTYARSR